MVPVFCTGTKTLSRRHHRRGAGAGPLTSL